MKGERLWGRSAAVAELAEMVVTDAEKEGDGERAGPSVAGQIACADVTDADDGVGSEGPGGEVGPTGVEVFEFGPRTGGPVRGDGVDVVDAEVTGDAAGSDRGSLSDHGDVTGGEGLGGGGADDAVKAGLAGAVEVDGDCPGLRVEAAQGVLGDAVGEEVEAEGGVEGGTGGGDGGELHFRGG